MKIVAFIINVESCARRREKILKELGEFDVLTSVIVKAIEGKMLTNNQIHNSYIPPKDFFQKLKRDKLSNNEIACALSHLKCLDNIVKEDLQYALVLEDDVVFSKQFQKSVLAVEKFMQNISEPSIVLLSARTIINQKAESYIDGFSMHRCIDGIGAYCYFVNNKAAQIILKKFIPFSYPYDHWFWHFINGVKIFSLQPNSTSFVGEEDDSLLREGRTKAWIDRKKMCKKHPILSKIVVKFQFKSIYVKLWKMFNNGKYINNKDFI